MRNFKIFHLWRVNRLFISHVLQHSNIIDLSAKSTRGTKLNDTSSLPRQYPFFHSSGLRLPLICTTFLPCNQSAYRLTSTFRHECPGVLKRINLFLSNGRWMDQCYGLEDAPCIVDLQMHNADIYSALSLAALFIYYNTSVICVTYCEIIW